MDLCSNLFCFVFSAESEDEPVKPAPVKKSEAPKVKPQRVLNFFDFFNYIMRRTVGVFHFPRS